MEQLSKSDPGENPIVCTAGPFHVQTRQLGTVWPASQPIKPAPSIAREVFALEDGEAILQWPTTLNADGVQELEDWLALVVKKLKRLKAKQSAASSE